MRFTMSSIWRNHASRLAEFINNNNEVQAHLYLEQLMLFPLDIQDKIIDDISHLSHCTNDAIANIIGHYSVSEVK